jgi:glycosyltransferase involved in cell wall biosynthesis
MTEPTAVDELEQRLRSAEVAVVVPAYRVAQQIERVVRGIPGWVRHVVVVVDASPDDTYARACALRDGGESRLVVLRHESNRGVGGAMQTGFREALRLGAQVVVKMDGDDQMDPVHLPALVQPLLEGAADVTKGNRYSSVTAVRSMPLVRIMGNAGLTFLVKAASGYWNLFDPANGYVALRREVLEALDIERLPRRFFFESGLLIELGIRRAVVRDVNMPARYGDESSSLSVTRTLLGFPPRLLWGLLRRVFWRYFVHDFSPVSLFLVTGLALLGVGLGWGGVRWWQLNVVTSDYASTGEVILPAMAILLGVQLLLQAVVLDVTGVPRVPLSRPLPPGDAAP